MLPSILVLSAVAVAALMVTRARPVSENDSAKGAAAVALTVAVVVQSVHFAEETATGLHERLPALFGLSAMPFSVFVVFNVAWIGIWVASVPGLRFGRVAAFFAAWFLAIAGVLNGVAHPLLAVASGGYFPGLVTSPFIGLAGAFLWFRLRGATERVVLV